jgi:hypothetical protein
LVEIKAAGFAQTADFAAAFFNKKMLAMQKQLSRQHFLALAALVPLATLEACKTAEKTSTVATAPAPATAAATASKPTKPPALAADLVKEFVGKSHGDLARVKELYAQEPGLLNAAWDWGGGDFETGLEAAGHVGNREIALFLLEKGARMNVFCAAMLGRLDIVKAVLTAFPELKNSKGPHGLMLKHHALKGGEQAKEVLAYLDQVGAS